MDPDSDATSTLNAEGDFGAEALVRVLMCRFGDGSVYLEESADRAVYRAAQALGLISGDGYLTRAGRRFLSEHGPD